MGCLNKNNNNNNRSLGLTRDDKSFVGRREEQWRAGRRPFLSIVEGKGNEDGWAKQQVGRREGKKKKRAGRTGRREGNLQNSSRVGRHWTGTTAGRTRKWEELGSIALGSSLFLLPGATGKRGICFFSAAARISRGLTARPIVRRRLSCVHDPTWNPRADTQPNIPEVGERVGLLSGIGLGCPSESSARNFSPPKGRQVGTARASSPTGHANLRSVDETC